MTKLRLKVREIRPTNGAVVMVTEHARQSMEKKAEAFLAKKSIKPGGKPASVEPAKVFPTGQLIFIPLKDDKTKYAIDQVYEFELKKV